MKPYWKHSLWSVGLAMLAWADNDFWRIGQWYGYAASMLFWFAFVYALQSYGRACVRTP